MREKNEQPTPLAGGDTGHLDSSSNDISDMREGKGIASKKKNFTYQEREGVEGAT